MAGKRRQERRRESSSCMIFDNTQQAIYSAVQVIIILHSDAKQSFNLFGKFNYSRMFVPVE